MTEENYESDDMALIEEAIFKAEQDIADGTKLIAGNAYKDDREGAQDKNVIHPETQVPTTENLYNLRRRVNQRPD